MLNSEASLRDDFSRLGVPAGGVLLMNSSLRSLGYVVGGPVAVVRALLDVLTPRGTLVVPSQTPENRDPSRWGDPTVPEQWWPAIREHTPPFDPAVSHCRAMGLIAETVRTWPGAVRSSHPQVSFAALGARAAEMTARHDLDSELGEHSPLAAVEAARGHVLLLGVGYDRCTAFHLAEYRQTGPLPRQENSCAVRDGNGRRWLTYLGTRLNSGDFAVLGEDFEREGDSVARGRVGAAEARLMPISDAVAFAEAWFRKHR